MRDQLKDLEAAATAIRDEYQAAQVYWDTYRALVPIATPEQRKKLMQMMAADARLECAALIAGVAYPTLIWTASSNRHATPPSHDAALFDGPTRLASGASLRNAGDALLQALLRHTITVRNN